MKKIILTIAILFSFFLTLSVYAQTTTTTTESINGIVYGNVASDGYNKIKKGAFWATRPNAKKVFNGEWPAGVDEIITFTEDNFVRFSKGNFSSKTKNYIVFPVGSSIYREGNKWFAAICGNEIDFFGPVNSTKVITITKTIKSEPTEMVLLNSSTNSGSIFQPETSEPVTLSSNLSTASLQADKILSKTQKIKIKKYRKTIFLFGAKVRKGWSIGIDVAGTLGALYGGYKLIQKNKNGGSSSTPPTPPGPQTPPTPPTGG